MEKNQFTFKPSWNPPAKYKDRCNNNSNNTNATLISTPQEYANDLLAFALKYRAIFEGRLIRFFLDQLWQLIPHEWHAALVECPYEHYLDLYQHVREDWPESLQQFLNEARDLSMPRDIAPELLVDKPDFNEIYGMDAFATGMRDKKLHEVEILSKLIHDVNDTCQIDTLIDIGAGKGYVCNVLEYLYNYHVIAVEGNDCHAQRADARSAKVQRHLYLRRLQQKYGEDTALVRAGMKEFHEKPSHVTTYFLKYNETDVKDFDHVIEESYKQFSEQNSKNEQFSERDTARTPADRIGLISLHGCGDLSCTLLDLFMNWSRAESLVCVPCCFNKLKERPDGSVTAFPLSSLLQGRTNSVRTLGLVDCATESTAQWAQGNTHDVLVRLATAQHRAILESALRHYVPDQSLVFCVKKTRQKSHFTDFNRYLNYVFSEQRLKIALQGKTNGARGPHLPEDIVPNWAEIQPEIVALAERLHVLHARDDKAMLAYCTLQVVLAPVLESLIVIDRYLYLTEHGVTCQVLPVFDAATSPRNLAIIARKHHL